MQHADDGLGNMTEDGKVLYKMAKEAIEKIMDEADKRDVSFTSVSALIATTAWSTSTFRTVMKRCE